jgi:hypothetical protein
LFDIEGNPRSDTPDVGAYEFGDCEPPAAPAEIGGLPSVCATTVHSFQVEAEPGLLYNWTLTGNATLLDGQGSGEITVQFADSDVLISVTAETNCGESEPAEWFVEVVVLPLLELTSIEEPLCDDEAPLVLADTVMNLLLSYSGTGIVGNTFDPSLAGEGAHEITYVYSDLASVCSDTGSFEVLVEVCLGVEELASEAVLQVYPNPMSERLLVQNPRPGELVEMRIFDSQGRLLERHRGSGATLEWQRGNLAAGLYWIQLYSGAVRLGNARVVVP